MHVCQAIENLDAERSGILAFKAGVANTADVRIERAQAAKLDNEDPVLVSIERTLQLGNIRMATREAQHILLHH
jgi:hypothetical protein